ncbi:succinoglycan biosynthesis protein ExoV [Novosphingobium sp. 1529]|uniref:hypothetical protein n=1 Tax=Novosphingobium sp. 1529 TaxID=3156424 RepID=UPI0033920E41
MKLFYFQAHHGNFGDALNDWIWDALLSNREEAAEDVWLSGIGTILNHRMPRDRRWVVMGSGVGYGSRPADFGGDNWDVLAVRGPLSARVLGLEPKKGITDGAMFLSILPELTPEAPAAPRKGVAFMPHYMSVASGRWEEVCQLAGLDFIHPCWDTKDILVKLRSAELVIADAMHAAIVADTLRTPWIAASLNPTTDSFKWNDWCWSMQMTHEPNRIPGSTLADVIKGNALSLYGEDMLIQQVTADKLCARHAERSQAAESLSTQLRYKVAKRLIREVAVGAAKIEARCVSKLADRRVERAAEVLGRVARMAPTLSQDSVFFENRQRMRDALHVMAKRYDLAINNKLAL